MYVACSPDRRINANLRAATGGSV